MCLRYQLCDNMPPKIDPDTINAMVAAAFKLPEFYRHRPEVWFSFAESQFLLQNIVDDGRKFAYVVSSLHPDVAELITDTIMPPPEEDKYKTIKARLLKEFTLTAAERAAKLLDLPGLGDQRPSQLLTRMLALLPADEQAKPSIVIKELFLRQLPAEVRQHLLDKYDLDLRALALEADMFFSTAGARINAVRAPAATAGRTQQPPPRSRAPPPRQLSHMDFCYFHRNFGKRARRCQSPCSYRPGN